MTPIKTPSNEINASILSELLKSNGNFVSGNHVADSLNISRVSIWSHLEKLRKDGFILEAIRNRGYRIQKEPASAHPDLISAYLKLKGIPPPPLVYLEETDSTNNEVERQLANKRSTPFVVISGKQTQGRGRYGRTWHSNDHGNLYVSFGFKPNSPPPLIKSFTPWIATQLCHLLHQEFALPIEIKWPNDLLFNGKKICGMLVESHIDVDSTRDLILGIGLNINGNPQNWPEELQQIATSIEVESGKTFNINKVSASVIACILSAYTRFTNNTWQVDLPPLWAKYDALYNKHVKGFHGTTPIEGIAKGINDLGALKLLQASGSVLLLDVGEISFSGPTKLNKY